MYRYIHVRTQIYIHICIHVYMYICICEHKNNICRYVYAIGSLYDFGALDFFNTICFVLYGLFRSSNSTIWFSIFLFRLIWLPKTTCLIWQVNSPFGFSIFLFYYSFNFVICLPLNLFYIIFKGLPRSEYLFCRFYFANSAICIFWKFYFSFCV